MLFRNSISRLLSLMTVSAVALSSACATVTSNRPVFIAPDNVQLEGEAFQSVSPDTKNIAVLRDDGFLGTSNTLTLRCPDGSTETREVKNDAQSTETLYFTAYSGLLGAVLLGAFGYDLLDGAVSDVGWVALGVGGASAATGLIYTFAGQPSEPVTVLKADSVCAGKASPAAAPAAEPASPETPPES